MKRSLSCSGTGIVCIVRHQVFDFQKELRHPGVNDVVVLRKAYMVYRETTCWITSLRNDNSGIVLYGYLQNTFHALNRGEQSWGPFFTDGYDSNTYTAYEFAGCFISWL